MRKLFQHHLYSSAGAAWLDALADRAEGRLGQLADAWRTRHEAEGFARLLDALSDAITALDSPDLRTPQIRLRPISSGEVPVSVTCKLARAFVEHLAGGDKRVARDALEALAAAAQARPNIVCEMGFRAALAELFAEDGDYDRAVAAIEANLAVQSACPYSQYLLHQTLLKRKRAGLIANSSRVCLDDLSDRFCERPFTTILTVPSSLGASKGGDAEPALHACDCAGMLPYPLGGTQSEGGDGAGDLWNGREAQEIRRSILEGEFTYCAPLVCPYIVKGNLPRRDEVTDPVMRDIIANKRTHLATAPRRLSLAHDVSCNIACPTCRSEIMTVKNSAREVMDRFIDRTILPLLRDATVDLIVSGDGDPIASKHYRRLLHNLDPVRHNGVGVYLVSNGLLITPKEWESLSHVHHLIKGILISIDAAEAATYEDVRRPGKWDTLTANMDFIANLRRTGAISYFVITFVVQKKNFEQMPAFVELGHRWSVDRVLFSKLFGILHAESLDADELRANAVVDEDHPDHARLLEVLRHPILRSKEVDLFNIAPNLSATAVVDPGVSPLDAAPTMAVVIEETALSEDAPANPKKRPFWKSLLRRGEKSASLNA